LMIRETVAMETFATLATSLIVGFKTSPCFPLRKRLHLHFQSISGMEKSQLQIDEKRLQF
jgi:hypothetical protein